MYFCHESMVHLQGGNIKVKDKMFVTIDFEESGFNFDYLQILITCTFVPLSLHAYFVRMRALCFEQLSVKGVPKSPLPEMSVTTLLKYFIIVFQTLPCTHFWHYNGNLRTYDINDDEIKSININISLYCFLKGKRAGSHTYTGMNLNCSQMYSCSF